MREQDRLSIMQHITYFYKRNQSCNYYETKLNMLEWTFCMEEKSS